MHALNIKLSKSTLSTNRQRIVKCNQAGNFGDSPLIIPGQSNPRPGGGGGLVFPGQSSSPPGRGAKFGGGTAPSSGNSLDLEIDGVPSGPRNFSPPPGFMNATSSDIDADDTAAAGQNTDSMLSRLRANAGKWHQLAKVILALQQSGIDGQTVQDISGLERRTQHLWVSTLSVYQSIKMSGQLTDEQLKVFDHNPESLNELRMLSASQRTPAARYIAEHGLVPSQAQVLARAIKEHERRKGEGEGFTNSPGDCLAYKYYRDALECGGVKKLENTEAYLNKGLAVAELTEGARQKIQETLEDTVCKAGEENIPFSARLSILRLEREEVGYRPIAMVGTLGSVNAATIVGAPKVATQSAVFSAFTIPPEAINAQWVCLPNWSVVLRAGRPAALFVENCLKLPSVREALGMKEDDAKKVLGSGILVVDSEPESMEVDENEFYMIDGGSGGASMIKAGSLLVGKDIKPFAKVLFLARPPAKDTTGATTSNLLSV